MKKTNEYIPLSKEEIYSLIKKSQSGDKEAKEKMTEINAGLVNSIASRYISSKYEYEDLVQLGYIGLLKAIDGFDTSYDVMFSTYAVPMIAGEIRRFLRDDGRIKVSRGMKKNVRDMRLIREEYEQKFGRIPRIGELAELMKISKEEVAEILEAESIIRNISSTDDVNLPEMRDTKKSEPFDDTSLCMMDLKNIIGELKERDRQVIVLRYFNDLTQQQTGELLGISQVQVSRVEKRVLCMLKQEIVR